MRNLIMVLKPARLNNFFENNPSLIDYITNIVQECGNPNGWSPDSYIIKNKSTILIYTEFSYRPETYAVVAIYTDESSRNEGSAKNLLTRLPSLGALYFDTYSEPLISLLKKLGAFEEEVFLNKPSTQLILNT